MGLWHRFVKPREVVLNSRQEKAHVDVHIFNDKGGFWNYKVTVTIGDMNKSVYISGCGYEGIHERAAAMATKIANELRQQREWLFKEEKYEIEV